MHPLKSSERGGTRREPSKCGRCIQSHIIKQGEQKRHEEATEELSSEEATEAQKGFFLHLR